MSSDTTASLLLKKQLAELMKSPDSGMCRFIFFSTLAKVFFVSSWTFAASFLNRFWTFKKKNLTFLCLQDFQLVSLTIMTFSDGKCWSSVRQVSFASTFFIPRIFFLLPRNTNLFFFFYISDKFSSLSLRLTHNTQIRSMKVDFSKVSHAQLNIIMNESEANLVIFNFQHTCYFQKSIHSDHHAWSSWQSCGIQTSTRTAMVSQFIVPSSWIINFVLF